MKNNFISIIQKAEILMNERYNETLYKNKTKEFYGMKESHFEKILKELYEKENNLE